MNRLGGAAAATLAGLLVATACGGIAENASERDPCGQLEAFRARLEAQGCAAADLTETLQPTPWRSCETILQAVAACAQDSECSTYPVATSCPGETYGEAWEGE